MYLLDSFMNWSPPLHFIFVTHPWLSPSPCPGPPDSIRKWGQIKAKSLPDNCRTERTQEMKVVQDAAPRDGSLEAGFPHPRSSEVHVCVNSKELVCVCSYCLKQLACIEGPLCLKSKQSIQATTHAYTYSAACRSISIGRILSLAFPGNHFFFVSIWTETKRNTKLFRLCLGLFRETLKFLCRILFRNKVELQQAKMEQGKKGQIRVNQSETNRVKIKKRGGTVGGIMLFQLFHPKLLVSGPPKLWN